MIQVVLAIALALVFALRAGQKGRSRFAWAAIAALVFIVTSSGAALAIAAASGGSAPWTVALTFLAAAVLGNVAGAVVTCALVDAWLNGVRLDTFVATARAEWFRLTRSRAGRAGLVVPALLGVVQLAGAQVVAKLDAARRAVQGVAPQGVTKATTAFALLADGVGGLGAMALVMIALLVGAFTLVREREHGSLSLLTLSRPRGAVILGKTIGIALYVLVAFLALFVASGAAAALGHSFEGVVEDGFEMASARELWLETARAVGAGLPAVLCCACFGVLVSTVCSSVGSAAVGAVVPFTLLALFQGTLGRVADHFFVTFAPFFSQRAPLARFAQVARAFSDAHWAHGELVRATLVPTIDAVTFVVVAWFVARRRDV